MITNPTKHSTLTFSEAADRWLSVKVRYVKPNTLRVYRQHVKTLKGYLGQKPLQEVDIQAVRDFQAWRSQKAGATRVNAEISAVQMILKEEGFWEAIQPRYQPLPNPKRKVRQNMSEEEEARLAGLFCRATLDIASPVIA